MFEFLLELLFLLGALGLPFFFLFFQVVDFLLQHLDVQFQLLLDFDMVTNFGLIVLQLSFVLFGWEVDGVESGGELRGGSVVESILGRLLTVTTVLFFLKPELHEVVELGLDVCEDGECR